MDFLISLACHRAIRRPEWTLKPILQEVLLSINQHSVFKRNGIFKRFLPLMMKW